MLPSVSVQELGGSCNELVFRVSFLHGFWLLPHAVLLLFLFRCNRCFPQRFASLRNGGYIAPVPTDCLCVRAWIALVVSMRPIMPSPFQLSVASHILSSGVPPSKHRSCGNPGCDSYLGGVFHTSLPLCTHSHCNLSFASVVAILRACVMCPPLATPWPASDCHFLFHIHSLLVM